MDLQASIGTVKGVGPKTEQLFARIGVYTIGDILLYFPREYTSFPEPIPYEEIEEERKIAIEGRIVGQPVLRRGKNMQIVQAQVVKNGITVHLVWFRTPYVKNQLLPGRHYIFYGKVKRKGTTFEMEQPAIYEPDKYQALTKQIQPIYPLVDGLTNTVVQKTIKMVFEQLGQENREELEYFSQDMKQKLDLREYTDALEHLHYPETQDDYESARKRLVFDEFFHFLVTMQLQRAGTCVEKNTFFFEKTDPVRAYIEKLPFTLTNGQLQALEDILRDLQSEKVMQRLVQGDVGCGKTLVAFFAMLFVSENGYQSALMAPTEVLARQHYQSFVELCKDFGLNKKVILLTGSLTAKGKREAYKDLLDYPDAFVIGTSALIQEKSVFHENLALVVTDEQHRFGVRQRQNLSEKGLHPHILVMSATPIPRSLAIILYGDLDISMITEVPKNRLPIKNCVITKKSHPTAYKFFQKEILEGHHQGYVICPMIEANEENDLTNVLDYTQELKKVFPPEIQITCLHGKMKPGEKDEIMEAFAKNQIQILVSTTVVEVGVDVPNATVMMIENAERFGLAQLHQLRGRVGRGKDQSYCILVNGKENGKTSKRLEILNKSNDGFFIANEDLKLRGPGELMGVRQSGDLFFKLADIYHDANILTMASNTVGRILSIDPLLQMPEHEKIARRVEEDPSLGLTI